jgi:hypothetical protein
MWKIDPWWSIGGHATSSSNIAKSFVKKISAILRTFDDMGTLGDIRTEIKISFKNENRVGIQTTLSIDLFFTSISIMNHNL